MSSTVADFFDNFEDVLYVAGMKARGAWEKQFVEDLADKFDEYGERMFLSERQYDVLTRITDS